jgi:hypothetical protein
VRGYVSLTTSWTAALSQASMAERPIALPPVSKERAAMPISQYLNGERFDPESLRIIGLAFEVARAALHIQGRRDAADKLIAEQILELAKAGERDPDRLSEYALAKIREADGCASQLFQASSASAAQAGSSTNPVSRRSRSGRVSY